MKADESKAKYDWTHVPKRINWLAKDECGQVFGYNREPVMHECHNWWHLNYKSGIDVTGLFESTPKDWRESLEQRPHPCATQCPNFTDEQCCHCLVGA